MRRILGIACRILVAVVLSLIAFAAAGVTPQLISILYLAAATPWLFTIDIREHRLPNALVLPAIAAGAVSCAGEWIATGRPPLVPLISGIAYAAFLLLLHVVGGMGMGDVKLGGALGLASWNLSVAVLSPVTAFLVGGLVATALILAGRRGSKIAFGPYLLGGYWAAVALVGLIPEFV